MLRRSASADTADRADLAASIGRLADAADRDTLRSLVAELRPALAGDAVAAFDAAVALAEARLVAADQRAEAERELDHAEHRRAEVTASVAHELRTPLTTIRGFIETLLLREDLLGASDRRYMLEVSLRNTVDLTHRVSTLLEHAKLEADHVTVVPRVQPLAPAIGTVLEACSGLVAAHELVVDVPAGLLVEVDEEALDHVLANLLSNSAKYAPPGTTITVRAEVVDDATVVVSVEDRGAGIPAEDLPHVFERFYRGDDRGRRQPGTGIGLAIVRRYVELAGGRVWVESTEGAGTTVRFTLPRADPDGLRVETDPAAGDQLLALQTSSQAPSPRCHASTR